MAGDAPSLQDIVRQRQQSEFVGREQRLTEFRENLRLPVGDGRRFIVNIHGVAGVGKTFLAKQYRKLAREEGAVCAFVDDDYFDVVETMAAIAADFASQEVRLPGFENQLATYRTNRHQVEGDPESPLGDMVTSATVKLGISAVRTVPLAGAVADVVDQDAAAAQMNRARAYLSRRFRKKADVDLLLKPVEILTKSFVRDLAKLAEERPVALFFDTYERTASFLEGWVLDVFAGKYGDLPANLTITISGQYPLDAGRWSPYRGIIAVHPLERFTDEEAREFLARQGVSDSRVVEVILALSGRLPVWMATLAESRPISPEEVADPTDSAVKRFLQWESDGDRKALALDAALPRKFNLDIVTAAWDGEGGPGEMFEWLCRLPFVVRGSDDWRYHDAARNPMTRLVRSTSPQRWRKKHLHLADHFAREREALGLSENDGWSDKNWQGLLLEESYHHLCAAPRGALDSALEHAARSTEKGLALPRRWAAMMAAAGADSGAEELQVWGKRLTGLLGDGHKDDEAFLTALIGSGRLGHKARARALAGRGETRRRAKRLDEAIPDLNSAVESDPQEADFLMWRAYAFQGLERFEDALADLSRAVELIPSDTRVIGERGRTLRLLRRSEEALADFDRAIELNPEYEWAIAERGLLYQLTERYAEALADFERAIELNSKYVFAITQRAETLRLTEQYEEALSELDRAMELAPESEWLLADRGFVFQSMGRYEEALTGFDEAIRLDPEHAWAIAQRAETLRLMERYDDALAGFDRALELDAESAWIHGSRGQVYKATWKFEEALVDFDRAIELGPVYAWIVTSRAQVYREFARFDETLAELDRAVELDQEPMWAIAQRAETLRMIDRFEEALVGFDQAIALAPEYAWAFGCRGQVHRELGHYEEALADLDRAIEISSHLDWMYYERADVHRHLGRFEEALADCDRAVEIDPKDGWTRYRRGIMRLRQNDTEGAEQDFLAALELVERQISEAPFDADHRFDQVIYLMALHRRETAEQRLREHLEGKQPLCSVYAFVKGLEELAEVAGIDHDCRRELLRMAEEHYEQRRPERE